MTSLLLQAVLLIWAMVTLLWLWSIFIKNVSIVDIFWGFGFVVVNALYVFMSEELNPRKILVLVLVLIWGLRLAIYLAIRNIGKGEDFRYQEFRRNYGAERYWWFSYFQTFLLQGALIIIVSLPLLGISASNNSGELNLIDYFGDSAVWWAYGIFSIAAGSYWQIIGSIIMTLLIIRVSGVALLEKTLNKSKPQYREYIQKTNAFFPWFPKK